MEIKRLQRNVDKHIADMSSYVPPEKRKKARLDPSYNLKGAARPAIPFYQDPNFIPETPPIDLMQIYATSMWDHSEGRDLLAKLYELAVALHNVAGKSKDAVDTFKRIFQYDPEDHTVINPIYCLFDVYSLDPALATCPASLLFGYRTCC
jgi:hypothetical protein